VRTRGGTAVMRPERVLRLAAVPVLAAALVCTPGIAQALFTVTAKGTVTTSTLALGQPAGESITITCGNGKKLSVSVNSYGTVPGATSMELLVLPPSGPEIRVTGTTYELHPAATGLWKAQVRGLRTFNGNNTWIGAPSPAQTATC
jgi:hypothetical protein